MSRTDAALRDRIFDALSSEHYAEARRMAEHAMRRGTADDMIRYLHTYAVERMGDLPRAMREAEDYLAAGYREMRREYMRLRAAVAYRIGDPQAAEFYDDAYGEEPADAGLYSSFLLAQNAREADEGELFAAHCGYAALFADVPQYTFPVPYRHEKIRVGYISPDFRRNVMQNFIQPLLTAYDRTQFEVYVYSTAAEPDDVTAALRPYADVWRDVGEASPGETAARIRTDEIDVLIDLAGHAAGGALPVLARRPAPVQMLGLGYTATSGLRAVDAFLTDAVCDPPGAGHERYFTEELVRLPSQFCYVPSAHLPASRGTPARRRGYILFGVFNQYRKFTDEMLSVWREILERVPASRLLLKSQVFFAGEMRAAAEERLRRIGFDLGRVLLEPADTGYMRRYLDVDIALDTFPWPGGGTTCDALYMGVPVVTRCAARRSTRFGCALLSHIGLAELVAETPGDYIARAAALAGDLDTLDALHRGLRGITERSPVMDQEGYMRALEDAYRYFVKKESERIG
ncbi:glycosyl transferase family 41 [uncultured Selenomonas sp.]|nr:glycosyl transferase family 41 [uncultured Selenomonas sp.]